MKRLGRRQTKTKVEGHQNCGTCHPPVKGGKSRDRRETRKKMKESIPPMTKVFESRFHGQVYELDGIGYDVPGLTYWCRDNLAVQDIPLASLTMSKSDEKHGSKEFKKHAASLDQTNVPPIVCVMRDDGTLQIADGNHRAWNAMESGAETIQGYIVPQADLPDEAVVGAEEEE